MLNALRSGLCGRALGPELHEQAAGHQCDRVEHLIKCEQYRTGTTAEVDPGGMRMGSILCKMVGRKLHNSVRLGPWYQNARAHRQRHVVPVLKANKVLKRHSLLQVLGPGESLLD